MVGKENLESTSQESQETDEPLVFLPLPPPPICREFSLLPEKRIPSIALDKLDTRSSQEFAIYSENESRGMNAAHSCDILKEDSKLSMASIVSSKTSTEAQTGHEHGLYNENSGPLPLRRDLASDDNPTVQSPHGYGDYGEDELPHLPPSPEVGPKFWSEDSSEAHELSEVCKRYLFIVPFMLSGVLLALRLIHEAQYVTFQ